MKSVLIVGEGQLADFAHQGLVKEFHVIRQTKVKKFFFRKPDLALVLHDSWIPTMHREADFTFRSKGIPWLRGFVSFGIVMIGPLGQPNSAGCSQCADVRRLMAGLDRKEMWELKRWLAEQEGIFPSDAWASRTGLFQAAHLLMAEVYRVLEGRKAHTENHVVLINLQSLHVTRHFFLPHPQCPLCSQLPKDSAQLAEIKLQPCLKVSVNSFRSRSMKDLKKILTKDYLDYEMGLFNGKVHDLTSPFADASVNLPLINGDEGTAGRTHSYEESELTAVLEGLERYCGIEPRGKLSIIHDTYNNLGHQALDPLSVGVHEKEEYAKPGFPFKPFDPDKPMDWVWGYSFLHRRSILVPKLLAYYSLGNGDGFVYETSNGCAIGGSLEEAIFYGMMETVERDSFLLTWYAQLSLPRIDPASINDQEIQLMIQRLQTVAGYDLHLFNSTMENGIPSIWAIATNNKNHGIQHSCAAGAHLDPLRAVKGAIHEIAGLVFGLDDRFKANYDKCVRMYQDSSLVKGMEDHPMLYGLPQSRERLGFLLEDRRPLLPFDEEFKLNSRHSQADLTEDLRQTIEVFRKLNLDVIVINQTTSELKRNDLHCVKVLIPGMLPMTFGNHLKRVVGLNRVLNVPVELGYVGKPLTLGQLNPYPHPFA